ncbi:hypothetical protein R1flu_000967 [Riccia fluitans]|uniref:Uncharacterized protein n=1 Tax=Riccia fluitans TaxID=41844 RepID=A0ABD1Y540_9MARC
MMISAEYLKNACDELAKLVKLQQSDGAEDMKSSLSKLKTMVGNLMEIHRLSVATKARLLESELDKIISFNYLYFVYANTLQAMLKKVAVTEEGIRLAARSSQHIFITREVIQEAFGLIEGGILFFNNLV